MNSSNSITVVSGYQRSGTSLMMQMLAAGGVPVLVDESNKADEHNPRGYFEYECAGKLGDTDESTDWIAEAQGKAVKVIAYRLRFLPAGYDYRVIFMRRKIAEVLTSWGKMGLTRTGVTLSEREQILSFKMEYAVYEAQLMRQTSMRALFVHYNELLEDPPGQIGRILDFLGATLDREAMAEAIDPLLHRNRIK
ncbi:MAG: sulfotransferase [Syntrophaceae bacterium]|nr:sulfotransferase [Syntrophaceae bacterium]